MAFVLFWSVAAIAQQPLTSTQQCANYQQELVLADIAHQEARARCGNIIRQATDLETRVKALTEELEKEKAMHASTKEVPAKLKDASDATKTE